MRQYPLWRWQLLVANQRDKTLASAFLMVTMVKTYFSFTKLQQTLSLPTKILSRPTLILDFSGAALFPQSKLFLRPFVLSLTHCTKRICSQCLSAKSSSSGWLRSRKISLCPSATGPSSLSLLRQQNLNKKSPTSASNRQWLQFLTLVVPPISSETNL